MSTTSIYKTPSGETEVMGLYDTLMKGWPLPYETLNIPTRHGNTSVIVNGLESSPALVLLHGANANSTIWARDVELYSRAYRTYAVDILGEPGHSDPNRPAWNTPAYTEWLEDVLNGLNIEKAVLAGISQGAWIAQRFAVSNPTRVEKLVLICPGGIIPDKLSFLFKTVFYSLLGKRGTRKIVQIIYADQPVSEEVLDITAILIRNFRPRIGVLPISTDEELRQLTMPTLLIGGTKDVLRNIEKISERLSHLLPQLTTVIIPGAGHAVINTSEHILSFLSEPVLK